MGGGKKKKVTIGYRYFMGIQCILCYGPISSLRQMRVGERSMYRSIDAGGSDANITVEGQYIVQGQRNLFGGDNREGGVGSEGTPVFASFVLGGGKFDRTIQRQVGTLPTGRTNTGGDFFVRMGTGTDSVVNYLNNQISGPIPAYRRMAYVTFKRFYWGMNPYIKNVEFQIERFPDNIVGGTFSAEAIIDSRSSNPVQIIYEVLTNADWGMGYAPASIDIPSFQTASTALFNESFGLSMVWGESTTIEDFMTEVLKHINGSLFLDRTTGQFVLRLIRDDYVPASLPLFDETNIVDMKQFSRKTWGETINEITVVYTKESTGKKTPVTLQDMANIQVQGQVINQKKEYPGLYKDSLALQVAARDLQTLAQPLARLQIRVNREAWDLNVGDPFRVTWPNYGLTDVIFRCANINYGTLKDSHIDIDAMEDIFGLPASTYGEPQESGWVEPRTDPEIPTQRGIIESNYWDLVQGLGETGAVEFIANTPNDGFYIAYAGKPEPSHYNMQIIDRPNGTIADFVEATESVNDFCTVCDLEFDMETANSTEFTYVNDLDVEALPLAELVVIDDEYMQVWDIDTDNKKINVYRGMLDTVPVPHAAGATMFGVQSSNAISIEQYTDGEVIDIKFITNSAGGTLPENTAAIDVFTFTGRAGKPWPPGNLQVEGLPAFQPQGMTSGDFDITWAHRDKTIQTGAFVYQDDPSIGPEAGVVYNLRLYDEDDVLRNTQTGLSGTSFSWTTEDADCPTFTGRVNNTIRIELESDLSGEISHQFHNYLFKRADYGYGYGEFYGGFI